MSTRLALDFFNRDTIAVARGLLGQRLVHRLPNGERLSGRIVETEAYLGHEDPAAHSFGGRRTPRTEVMFAAAGTAYIYFIYGMHFCFNVVTMPQGTPEAVLVRALEPLEGVARMRLRRSLPEPGLVSKLANGPGKLCAALELGREHNRLDLIHGKNLFIENDGAPTDVDIVEGPRIGIGSSHDAVHWPLRFGVRGHPALSPPRFPEP